MKMESKNLLMENIMKIGELFPNCLSEKKYADGVIREAIDFEILKQFLSDGLIEGDEAYEFNWVGKKKAILDANTPIRKTLRPDKDNSKYWDRTENIYIKGDNFEVLKLLQESYLSSVKMIYIDPPYNTGNDFIYKDDFTKSKDEYDEAIGLVDEDGDRLFKNTDSNGRFHSDWCSMMYSRLILARNLLSDDGVIFISIDENEVESLTKICDETFGIENHVGTIIVKSNPRGSMSTSELASLHEYLLVYTKIRQEASIIGHPLSDDMTSEYKYSDENGDYRLLGLRMRGGFWRRSERPNLYFPIYVNPDTYEVSLEKSGKYTAVALPVQPSTMEDGTWRWSKEKIIQDKDLLIGKKISRAGEEVWDIYQKDYLNREGERRTKAKSIWEESEINYQNGTAEIKQLLGNSGVFDYSKPVFLIEQAMNMIDLKDGDIIMDFFSGSATTAHAVMKQNAEKKRKYRYILVQLEERINEKTEAYKEGYRTICDIGIERIKKAGEKLQDVGDTGFRVFYLDKSNMNDIYYSVDRYSQGMIAAMESNIKPDRKDLDLLFGCLLDWGLPLSLPYTSEEISGVKVHTYNDGDLIACFDENISEDVVKEIAKRQPLRAVFRDSSFASSPAKINVGEIFKSIAPDTSVKVI